VEDFSVRRFIHLFPASFFFFFFLLLLHTMKIDTRN
jgi:hypothetical protein